MNGIKVKMGSPNSRINYNQLERCFRSGYYPLEQWELICSEWSEMDSEMAKMVSAVICKWIASDKLYGKKEYR